jgi:glutamine cyclotransferase
MQPIAPLKQAVTSKIRAIQRWRVPRIQPVIVRALPHDPTAFTQGLVLFDGVLYESSGGHADSKLHCIDLADGQVRKTVVISNDFAEGIAVYGNRLYQLSWKSGRARVFLVPSLNLVDEFHYDGEGWGLAGSPDGLVMSNGTGNLQFLDGSFRALRRLRVTLNGLPTRRLNDLEWVGDLVYANVLWSSEILEISTRDGRVQRIIDCSPLTALADTRNVEHTLNGIAFNAERHTFYLTGKCWPSIFEVTFPGC